MKRSLLLLLFFICCGSYSSQAQESIARQWNEVLLEAIRNDFARPTVHARNLFHTSIAMYDAWAVYDTIAEPFLLGKQVGDYYCPFNGVDRPADVELARYITLCHAVYQLLSHRFAQSPGATETQAALDYQMLISGMDKDYVDTNYVATGLPAALGNYLAEQLIQFGFQDGANEQNAYANEYYQVANPPLVIKQPGNPNLRDPNRWQQITLDIFIDQSGNEIPFNTPEFLGPEWGKVTPFALRGEDLNIYQRNGDDYWVYHDPGLPPYLDTTATSSISDAYKWGFELVSIWSSHLDPADTTMWDISPASIGNIQDYPTTFDDYQDFYQLVEGGDASVGHTINPATGQPYARQLVRRADYARVLAEFWADGPDSETPPGHWFTILNYVHDHPAFERRYRGQGPLIDDFEWDVKAYFMLAGAVHDAAVTAWGIKGWYDYIRPVSAIRYLAELGQSSDSSLPSYHPGGITLRPGFIELVGVGDPLAGLNDEHIGKIKILAWKGPDYI